MIQFNWYELKVDSSNVPEGIIVLTHALAKGYNSIITSNESSLLGQLKVSYVPPQIYKNKWFIKTSEGIKTKYITKEPQSYFLNSSWLYEYSTIYNKILYLYALSQRSISNRNFFIPETFLEEKYWNNPYLKHRDGKIWFLPEIQKLTTHTKT